MVYLTLCWVVGILLWWNFHELVTHRLAVGIVLGGSGSVPMLVLGYVGERNILMLLVRYQFVATRLGSKYPFLRRRASCGIGNGMP